MVSRAEWLQEIVRMGPKRRTQGGQRKVRIHRYVGGTLAMFCGPQRVADHDDNGRLLAKIPFRSQRNPLRLRSCGPRPPGQQSEAVPT